MISILSGQSLAALPFVVCDTAGRILRTGSAPAEMIQHQAHDGELAFAGSVNGISQYIATVEGVSAATDRPSSLVIIDKTNVAANATETVTLSSVTPGSTVTVTGPASGSGVTYDDSVVLTFAVAGRYRVTVSNFPDLDFEANIYAT